MVNGIIADSDILEEDYIPQNIPCREIQKKELAFCISQVEKGRKPFDCLCHARIAIQTLKNAAYMAEKASKNKIALEDVRKAREKVEEIKRKYTLEKLGEHHKLIYEIIKHNEGITSNELSSDYTNGCLELGLEPRSERTLNNYLEELIALNYIKFERASVKGNVRKFFA